MFKGYVICEEESCTLDRSGVLVLFLIYVLGCIWRVYKHIRGGDVHTFTLCSSLAHFAAIPLVRHIRTYHFLSQRSWVSRSAAKKLVTISPQPDQYTHLRH